MYGNNDIEHSGNIAFLTGDDDKGTARMIVGQSGNITMGSGIWDFVDEGKDIHLVNIVENGILIDWFPKKNMLQRVLQWFS